MNLSYNLSDKLKNYLENIDKLRVEILTSPLTPRDELRLKWDASLERVIWSMGLNENPLEKKDIVRLLAHASESPKRKLVLQEKDVIGQKAAMNYLKSTWLGNGGSVTMHTIKVLYDLACRPSMGPPSGLTEYSEKRVNTTLEYLTRGQDHPVIQAGIAQIEIAAIMPFDQGNNRIGRLLSYLYLYKAGYDTRELVNLEEFYKRDVVTYKRILEIGKIQGNLTLWLEYFAYGLMLSLNKALENIRSLKLQDNLPAAFWKLTDRKRKILEALEAPGARITNKDVQRIHKVSQITASRDLSQLASLGLIFSNGHGRSVYYTKA